MATIYAPILQPENAAFPTSNFPTFNVTQGTNFPVSYLAYNDTADQDAFWKIPVISYGSGNLTLDIFWYADTASTNAVVWGAAIAAITPTTDSQDVETKAFATESTVTTSHLGTTGQREHKSTITISNLDSIATGDTLWIRVRRTGSSGSDTMTGDALFLMALLTYSDT